MGKLILYGMSASPPCRAVLLTLKALNLPYEYKEVNLMSGELKTKEFLAKNPQHTVPTLDDDSDTVWDSHAIVTYLVSKYGKNDALYPKDLLQRAIVDQRLHYESSVVFPSMTNVTFPMFFKGETAVPQAKIDAIIRVYDLLETFLAAHKYVAGDKLTVADFSLISTVTSLIVLTNLDAAKHAHVIEWKKDLEALPYYAETSEKGLKLLHDTIKSKNITIVA